MRLAVAITRLEVSIVARAASNELGSPKGIFPDLRGVSCPPFRLSLTLATSPPHERAQRSPQILQSKTLVPRVPFFSNGATLSLQDGHFVVRDLLHSLFPWNLRADGADSV